MRFTCSYCDSKKVKRIRKLTSNYVYKCKNCGLGFQFPLPPRKIIRKYYEETVYPEVWGTHKGSFGRMKKVTYKWIFSHLLKGKGEKLLDIGTGYGFCLLEAKRCGYNPFGIEPSGELSKIAREATGMRVINKFFEDTDLPTESFQAVCLFDTIEHMHNPWRVIKKASSLVKPGGCFLITTPDFKSLSARFLGRFWFHLKDEHYFYFSGEFLKKLLAKEDLKVVKLIPQKRPLSLAYLENHLRIYPIPIFSPILHRLVLLLPRKVKNKVFSVFDGNLLLIAQKA